MRPAILSTLALAALGNFSHPEATRAATFAVNSTLDAVDNMPGDGICETALANGVCTLRAAVMEANATLFDPDVIVLPEGTFLVTIAGVGEDAAATGDLDVFGDLTIEGTSSTSTVVDGGELDRVFHGIGNDMMPSRLTLNRLTVQNGSTSGNGGGVLMEQGPSFGGGVFAATDTVLVMNNALGDGGGVFLEEDTVADSTVTRCILRDNHAGGRGGGGVLDAHLFSIVVDSLVEGNAASAGGGISGARTIGNPMHVVRSTIRDNRATGPGGGLHFGIALSFVLDSRIEDNTAERGGGIASNSELFAVDGSTVVGNTATVGDGGGVLVAPGCANGGMSGTTIEGNHAAGSGGGFAQIHLFGLCGGLFLDRITVAGNSADLSGGGIAVDGVFSPGAQNSTVSGNRARGDAGGISMFPNMDLANVTVTANVADSDADGVGSGGGVVFGGVGFSSGLTRNSIIAGNTDGGGEVPDCGGTFASQGYNLIGDSNCTIDGDLTGNVTGVSPGLAPLADNGGPTKTHALLGASVARDAGNPAGCANAFGSPLGTDQRGALRVKGPACDIGAYESGCGDGDVDLGEECDDLNQLDGDCCSGVCRFEATGSSCDDDNACTTSDTCAAGTCIGGPPPVCDPCEICDVSVGCMLPPAPGCTEASPGGSVVVAKNSDNDPRDLLSWRWKAPGPIALADMGSPLAGTDYTLCLIDSRNSGPTLLASSSTPADGLCGGTPCWTSDPRGYRYTDRALTADGLLKMLLRPSLTGRGRIVVKGRGGGLDLPTFPLIAPVTLRLLRSDGPQCWEASFPSPLLSGAGVFRARSE